MLYSRSLAFRKLVLRIVPMAFLPLTPSCTNMSFVDSPNLLTRHSYLLHSLPMFVGTRGLSLTGVKASHYLRFNLLTLCVQGSVALCTSVRFPCLYLHMVPEEHPSYTLRTVSSRTDGRDLYGVIRYVSTIVVFGVGTQLPTGLVVTHRSNSGAGAGCYLFSSQFVCVKVG